MTIIKITSSGSWQKKKKKKKGGKKKLIRESDGFSLPKLNITIKVSNLPTQLVRLNKQKGEK